MARRPIQRHENALKAVERLRSIPDLCLLVLGKGDAWQNTGVRSIFLGSIDDEERLSFVYSAADLFLLPSSEDNFPNTALESLACGLPVVGSNVGGIPDIVRVGYTGSLVEKGDAEGFAKATEELLREPARREQMSENCRRVAMREYASEVESARYIELYEDVLENSGWKASRRNRSSDAPRNIGTMV